MPKFTQDQQRAIDIDGKNVIVSASAGSGKTAVLTERVFRKIKKGISIDNLLVLTFTNKAAVEMKERIRKKLEKDNLVEESEKLESAAITTFDAYALELVKRYSDVLNVSKDIKITDINIVNLYNKKILEEILDEYYQEKDPNFLDLIKKFCLKDDENLKELILDVFNKLDLIYDKEEYLNDYLNSFDDEEFSSTIVKKLEIVLRKKINYIEILLNRLVDNEVNFYDNFTKLLESTSYEDIIKNSNIELPRLASNSSDIVKALKKELKDNLDEIKKIGAIDIKTVKEDRELIKVLVEILGKLEEKTKVFKEENDIYTFADIYKLSIKLVTDYSEIREELKNKYNEILIDEYQDTNDLQELFISRIENNNIYVVGDIKQSIYKFRNANYQIFKEKYDNYKESDLSEVIDLNKNFRSREEVLTSINNLFKYLMRKDISFLDYNEHYMDFGFNDYKEQRNENSNYDLEIYTYEEDKKTSKEEQEIFLIARDIREKMNKRIKIYDKEINSLREVKYGDFVILIDRATSFDAYKKVFEYLAIPLSLEKDYDLSLEDDIYILKNIIKLIIKIKENTFDEEFKRAYLSLGRSFLFRYSDQQLFIDIIGNHYGKSDIYQKCLELSKEIDSLSASEMFMRIIDSFNYEERLNYITNIKLFRRREESIYDLIKSLEEAGNTIYEIPDLLEELLDDNDIKISLAKENVDAVRIMTIHKSKGLEFPICYFAGFYKKFNFRDLNKKILFDKDLGIVFSDNEILKYILKEKEKEAEIDEQIRLLYVALTRAREKMIMVIPKIDDYKEELTPLEKNNYNSFLSVIKSIYCYLDKYIVTKEVEVDSHYKYPKELTINYEDKGKLKVQNSIFKSEQLEQKKYSKKASLVDEEVIRNMDFGTRVHQILEYIDFNNPNLEELEIPEDVYPKIEKFIESDLIKNNKNSKFYQEYEFVYNNNFGVIDLMIENDKELIIVDYKLKNIDDPAYIKQLQGYKEAMREFTNKEIKTYLYSIYEEKIKEIL